MNDIRHDLQLYPRIPDSKTIHDSRYDPNTYKSIQSRVNNDAEFESKYIEKLVRDGWVALKTVPDIFLYPKGKTFKYRLNGDSLSGAPEGTFRSGGFFIGKNINEIDNSKIDNYFLYKGYNGCIFSLQIKDILEVYVKSPTKEISVFKKPEMITNFPVYLDNENGIKTVVYYASDSCHRIRFMNTMKYKKALATGKWSWSVVFN